jgi:hypothetical protein
VLAGLKIGDLVGDRAPTHSFTLVAEEFVPRINTSA